MAPLPKRRMSSARSGKRRSSIKLAAVSFQKCPNCGKMKLPHSVCPECGMYDGRVVIAPKAKTTVTKLTPAKEDVATETVETSEAK